MSEITDIFSLLESKPLTDILLTGFFIAESDRPDCQRFVPNLTRIYLEFGDQFLLCTSINQYDQLKIEIAAKMTQDPITEEETDFDFCICSVRELYLNNLYSENFVTGFFAFLDEGSDPDSGIVKSAEFRLGVHGSIFLDPLNLFGIRIGTEQQRDEWIENWASNREEQHPFQQLTWKNTTPIM